MIEEANKYLTQAEGLGAQDLMAAAEECMKEAQRQLDSIVKSREIGMKSENAAQAGFRLEYRRLSSLFVGEFSKVDDKWMDSLQMNESMVAKHLQDKNKIGIDYLTLVDSIENKIDNGDKLSGDEIKSMNGLLQDLGKFYDNVNRLEAIEIAKRNIESAGQKFQQGQHAEAGGMANTAMNDLNQVVKKLEESLGINENIPSEKTEEIFNSLPVETREMFMELMDLQDKAHHISFQSKLVLENKLQAFEAKLPTNPEPLQAQTQQQQPPSVEQPKQQETSKVQTASPPVAEQKQKLQSPREIQEEKKKLQILIKFEVGKFNENIKEMEGFKDQNSPEECKQKLETAEKRLKMVEQHTSRLNEIDKNDPVAQKQLNETTTKMHSEVERGQTMLNELQQSSSLRMR